METNTHRWEHKRFCLSDTHWYRRHCVVCVCVYVCMCVCVYVCMCECNVAESSCSALLSPNKKVNVFLCMHALTCVRVCDCKCVCVHMCACV